MLRRRCLPSSASLSVDRPSPVGRPLFGRYVPGPVTEAEPADPWGQLQVAVRRKGSFDAASALITPPPLLRNAWDTPASLVPEPVMANDTRALPSGRPYASKRPLPLSRNENVPLTPGPGGAGLAVKRRVPEPVSVYHEMPFVLATKCRRPEYRVVIRIWSVLVPPGSMPTYCPVKVTVRSGGVAAYA